MECCYFDLEKSTDLSTWKGRDQGTSDYTFLRKSTLFSKMFFKRWYVCTFAMWMLAHIFLILMRWWKQMIFWYSKKILEVLDLVKSSSILVGHGISKDMFCFVKPHFNLYTVEGTIWNLKRSEKLLFKHQVLQSDLVWTYKWPFQGLSDLHLGYQRVTLKKLVHSYHWC